MDAPTHMQAHNQQGHIAQTRYPFIWQPLLKLVQHLIIIAEVGGHFFLLVNFLFGDNHCTRGRPQPSFFLLFNKVICD